MLPITPGQPTGSQLQQDERVEGQFIVQRVQTAGHCRHHHHIVAICSSTLAGHPFLQWLCSWRSSGGWWGLSIYRSTKVTLNVSGMAFPRPLLSEDNATVIIELWWLWSDLVVHFLLAPTPSWSPWDACHIIIIISSWNCNGFVASASTDSSIVEVLLQCGGRPSPSVFVLKVQLVNW